MAAKQGPINTKSFGERIITAAWHSRPSWYLRTSEDHMIDPEAQAATARRMNATLTSVPSSQVAMLARPQDVVAVIVKAVAAPRPAVAQR
ncbi:MAG: hypothetical protein WDO69_02855 [Pseudomonadota bacterium]